MKNKIAKTDGNDPKWSESKALAIANGEGITDKKMAKILVSKASPEEKQAQLVNYLFDQNKDAMGFFAEMFQFRGKQSKAINDFKSQTRFDFEMFVSTFTTFLRDTAERIWEPLGNKDTIPEATEKLKDGGLNLIGGELTSLSLLAISFLDQADHLDKAIKKITEQRERSKGKGIYVDKLGITHSLYDEDIFDIIQQEKDELLKKTK